MLIKIIRRAPLVSLFRFYSELTAVPNALSDDSEVESLCSRHPELRGWNSSQLRAALKGAKLRDISTAHIVQHPWLLAEQSVERKLHLIGESTSWRPTEESLAVLALPETLVAYVARRLGPKPWKHVAERAQFLSEELAVSYGQVLSLFRRHLCLLTQDTGRLKRVLSLLREGQVPPDAILRDLWVFRHNETLMESRLKRALKVGLLPVRPWMLRCPEETFEAHLRRWEARADVLWPHADTITYLAERLDCSRSHVRFLAQKNPRLLTINAPKLQQLLDFLFANGYGPVQVSLFPRVLSCSLERLHRRIALLKDYGIQQPPLHMMAATEKEFERACRRIMRVPKC
ncbi:transcription termination factor, mitochondrial-like [Ornithodoros turicata]|uniref:transcription termination factor, mitochondrial-like n=1 Tax=Ornithodoros turicata TaxID=34597 RepID=UPI0031399840